MIPSGVLGMDETVKRGYCSTASANQRAISILSLAEMAGMSTGIVTTTRVTHATPASAYAFSADRGWESDADKEDEALDDASACKDIGIFFSSNVEDFRIIRTIIIMISNSFFFS